MNFSNSYGLSVARTSFGLGLVAVIISIILTILLVVLVVPAKRREGLPNSFRLFMTSATLKDFFLKRFSRFSTFSQQSMLCSQAFLLGSQADMTLA